MAEPMDFIEAARVPQTVTDEQFGLWNVRRLPYADGTPWPTYVVLRRHSWAGLHLIDENNWGGEIVMEDGLVELQKHLPIWLAARGRVLVTGLGLGCVVRGLLHSPAVEHIDVVEIDGHIIAKFGPEFVGDRVAIHQGDALAIEIEGAWDYAWHDLWTDGNIHLQRLHAQLFRRFRKRVRHQGAWGFPRFAARLMPWRPLGAPRRRAAR